MSVVIAKYGDTQVQYKEDVQPAEYKRLDESLTVPNDGGTYYQLKHWDDLGRGDNVSEFPEMFIPGLGLLMRDPNGRAYDYVEMPDQWLQFYWDWWNYVSQYRLPKGKIEGFYKRTGNERTFAKTTPGSLTYVYVDMLEAHRAFTEAGSAEGGFRDPVTDRNMDFPINMMVLFDPTCGAMLREKRKLTGKYLEFEALDVLKPPPTIEWLAERPWLHFWCTQWGKLSGSTRFPQIKNANEVHGLPPAGISAPLMSIGGTIKVLKTACVPLVPGQPWTPYKPKG